MSPSRITELNNDDQSGLSSFDDVMNNSDDEEVVLDVDEDESYSLVDVAPHTPSPVKINNN